MVLPTVRAFSLQVCSLYAGRVITAMSSGAGVEEWPVRELIQLAVLFFVGVHPEAGLERSAYFGGLVASCATCSEAGRRSHVRAPHPSSSSVKRSQLQAPWRPPWVAMARQNPSAVWSSRSWPQTAHS